MGNEIIRPRLRTATWVYRLAPLAVAVFVFVGNQLAIIRAVLHAPPGQVPLFAHRFPDVAQHLTWIYGFRNHVLIPNFHAPWVTEPALFNPICLLAGRASAWIQVTPEAVHNVINFAFYILAAYALLFLLRSFTKDKAQLLTVAVNVLCSVPLKSLFLLPAVILNGSGIERLPGGSGWYISTDGFLHGGMFLKTFGTATVWLAFGLLARFLSTGQRRFLIGTGLIAFLSAINHPFEAFIIVAAGSAALYLAKPRRASRLLEVGVLTVSVALGLAPYLFLTLRVDWLSDVAHMNRWHAPPPWYLLAALGIPTILALVLIFAKARVTSNLDVLLRCWFVTVLVSVYIPWLPWAQHLLDGFCACAGLIVTRQLWRIPAAMRLFTTYPRRSIAMTSIVVLLSAAVYPIMYLRGGDPSLAALPASDYAAINWMRGHTDPSSLLLAPPSSASWYATVPIHTFASHWLFSITAADQLQLADSFFRGILDHQSADRLLKQYGVRYVVALVDSPSQKYLDGCFEKARFDALVVCEFPGRSMMPYQSPRDP